MHDVVLALPKDNPVVGFVTLFGLGALFVAVNLLYAWLYPRRACRSCGVSGKDHQPRSESKYWRACSRCDGKGWELRPGYRFIQWWRGRER